MFNLRKHQQLVETNEKGQKKPIHLYISDLSGELLSNVGFQSFTNSSHVHPPPLQPHQLVSDTHI